MVTSIQPLGPGGAPQAAETNGSAGSNNSKTGFEAAGTTQTFLQLLVAQIKNQNPLNPTDAVQFVSQLAQFSELEQTIGIRTDVQALRQYVDIQKGAAQPDAGNAAV